MRKTRTRFAPGCFSVLTETLESRVVLSAGVQTQAAEVAAFAMQRAATTTTLAVSAGTLGQPVTFTVTVRGPAAAGSPQGTVNISDHGSVIGSATLVPSTSANARFATSTATYTMTPQPGGAAYYFGKHTVSASFLPSAGTSFQKSHASKAFSVSTPAYTTLTGGVKYATVVPGSGPAIASGQTANVLYTGYLAKNGHIFDDSVNDGGTPFSFTLGAGDVIPGFDAGTTGMQAGESRVIQIPAAEGYGNTPTGTIPANSTLVFEVTLASIS